MENTCNEYLCEETTRKLKLDVKLVRDIAAAQGHFTEKIIKGGTFASIRYVYLGAIKAQLKKIQKINDLVGKR